MVPPEIAAIVSLKFTFAITYNEESYLGLEKVFLIRSIVAVYGRIPNIHLLPPNTPTKPATITKVYDSPSNCYVKGSKQTHLQI
jgi:hypothetical protein